MFLLLPHPLNFLLPWINFQFIVCVDEDISKNIFIIQDVHEAWAFLDIKLQKKKVIEKLSLFRNRWTGDENFFNFILKIKKIFFITTNNCSDFKLLSGVSIFKFLIAHLTVNVTIMVIDVAELLLFINFTMTFCRWWLIYFVYDFFVDTFFIF